MKVFPARIVKDYQTGQETWQKAAVRLIGGAGFYERRRLKMSWPAWCALPKNAHLPKPTKVAAAAPSAAQTLAPSVEAFFAQQAAEEKRQKMGDSLYPIISAFLAENEKDMKAGGVWHPKMTAGKLTGMLLEGFSYNDLYPMLTDMDALADNLVECCDLITLQAELNAANGQAVIA